MSLIPLGFWKNHFSFEYLNPVDCPTYGWSFWKRRICTRLVSTVKIYINGIDQDLTLLNNTGASFLIESVASWRIADNEGGVGGAISGEISVMRLYKPVLTQTQVTRNFNLEK